MNNNSSRIPYRRSAASGAVVFPQNEYGRNHVIWPGTEKLLDDFVHKNYHGRRLKLRPAHSSNSEDALTWSCFNTLRQLDGKARGAALDELWWMAFAGMQAPPGVLSGKICIGETYRVGKGKGKEETEVDASIEGPGVLVFIEAKLYSPLSLAEPEKDKPHDQIARKLRVGVREALLRGADFYFIVLDIAPNEILRGMERKNRKGFGGKWLTAESFSRYKGRAGSSKELANLLGDIPESDAAAVARNMGWLSWSDVYKAVLRAVVTAAARV